MWIETLELPHNIHIMHKNSNTYSDYAEMN